MIARITGPDKVIIEVTLEEYSILTRVLRQSLELLKRAEDPCACKQCGGHH